MIKANAIKYEGLNLRVEKTIFVLVAISLAVYISGYHLAKSLLYLQVLLALFLFIPNPKTYLTGFSRIDIAWLSVLLLYPCSYYLAYIIHGRPIDFSRGNDVLIDAIIGLSLFVMIRKKEYFTLKIFCRCVAVSIAIAGTVVVWKWGSNDFQGRWTTGTNLILIFACAASAATVMCFWYFINCKENVWVKVFLFYAGMIGFASIFAAGSRGALLSVIVLFCLYAYLSFSNKKIIPTVMILLVIGAGFFWGQNADNSDNRISKTISTVEDFADSGVITDNSMSLRIQMWRAGIAAIKEHPVLGLGSGALKETLSEVVVIDERIKNYDHVHNTFIQAWSALGIPGLISILSLVVIPVWAGLSRKSPITPYLIIIAVAFGVNGMTNDPFLRTYSLKYYLMVVGLLLILHQQNTDINLKNN